MEPFNCPYCLESMDRRSSCNRHAETCPFQPSSDLEFPVFMPFSGSTRNKSEMELFKECLQKKEYLQGIFPMCFGRSTYETIQRLTQVVSVNDRAFFGRVMRHFKTLTIPKAQILLNNKYIFLGNIYSPKMTKIGRRDLIIRETNTEVHLSLEPCVRKSCVTQFTLYSLIIYFIA